MNRRAMIVGAAAATAMVGIASCTRVDNEHTGSVSTPPSPPAPPAEPPKPSVPLKSVASGNGRYFGTAVQLSALSSDKSLQSVLARECSSITPEWAMKWDSLASGPNNYNFTAMDRQLAGPNAPVAACR